MLAARAFIILPCATAAALARRGVASELWRTKPVDIAIADHISFVLTALSRLKYALLRR
jgi:hypothetical protein